MKNKLKILCAAIWCQDGKSYAHQPINVDDGYVIVGYRHHNCFTTKYILTNGKSNQDIIIKQGFITTNNLFVDRTIALDIAIRNKQVLDMDNIRGNELYSEDLY